MDDLIKYRLQSAEEKLRSAYLLLQAGQYKDSIGRSYYAIFAAVRAVLARDGIDFAKHSFNNGIISQYPPESFPGGYFLWTKG